MPVCLRIWALVVVLFLTPHLLLAQNQGLVKRESNLRADASTNNPPIGTVPKGSQVTLLDPSPKNGFYHVRTMQKKEGWLWGINLDTGSQVSPVSRKLVRRPMVTEMEREGVGAAACSSDLSGCPASGCSAPEDTHGQANELKRRVPTGHATVLLTFDDFQSLQQLAEGLVGVHKELTAAERAKLRGMTVAEGSVSEGDVVSIVGFLVGVPHPNTGESVNCNLKGAQNNDFHIPISNNPDNSDFQGIVVEMIPQNRPTDWTIGNLTQVENNRQLVMITGGLFYDNFHFVNADPTSPKQGQPHRFSLWEVHPISEFVVCTKTDNSCDPTQSGDWTPLGVNP